MKSKPLAVISGLGFSELSRKPIGTSRELAAAAVQAAIEDAGLQLQDIDGLLINRSPVADPDEVPLRLQNDLQLRDLGLLAALDSEGSTAVQMIQYAAMAIGQGLATNVVCVFADTPVKAHGGGDSFVIGMPLTGVEGWERSQGMLGACAAYALAAQRHMAVYGTTSEQLGAYAVSCRQWALRNPQAFLTKPLTLADYLQSPMLATPFRILDCAFPVNGGIAVVVTGVERARDLRHAPVYVHGIGQGHRGRTGLGNDDPEFNTGAAQAGSAAYRGARVTARDVTACQFYDAFSYVGILALEEYGFCERGQAAAFVAAGQTAPGGTLPVNTGGGHLSGFYLQGVTPISEGVIQVRGAGGRRQVPRNDLVLVTGNGGCLDYHACMLLSPHVSLN
ncbi:thiolase family protein [Variovorax paradoxus]|uniref:thiolase family protein n=1 Tax=Variovorax paradoxus TaxID=34073 RepID=UPI001ABC91FD